MEILPKKEKKLIHGEVVWCLGYITDSQGLHKIQDKVDVVQKLIILQIITHVKNIWLFDMLW